MIHLVDSLELQEMGDQSPDPWPVPPADRLWDAPQRDRCQDLGLGRRPWIRSVTDKDGRLKFPRRPSLILRNY